MYVLPSLTKLWLVSFDFAFHSGQEIDRIVRVTPYPPVMEFSNGERIDVIPAKTPLTLHDDEVGFFENTQVLHHSAAIQLLEVLDQFSSCS